jgi:hypothetical protein
VRRKRRDNLFPINKNPITGIFVIQSDPPPLAKGELEGVMNREDKFLLY